MKNNTNTILEPAYPISEEMQRTSAPKLADVERGETERDVNRTVLENLAAIIPADQPIKALDLPCGGLLFLSYLKRFYPHADLTGSDIMPPKSSEGVHFVQMDLTKEFLLPRNEQFDLITSISGVMMFSNTQSFIENCAARLKKNGTMVVTNDNSLSIMDKLRMLFLGRVKKFNPIYEDDECMVQNVPVMELVRLMRIHGIDVEKIQYTAFYKRDLILLPVALLVYPVQCLYLSRFKSELAKKIKWQAYPFKHLFSRHYVVIGKKRA